MIFTETRLKGAFVIQLEPLGDDRGFFARSFCRREFAAHGLKTDLVQGNISFNHRKGTVRGLHYQTAPYEEAKLVRCTRGAMFDVIVDLREDSPTFKQWAAETLTAENRLMFYIPEGFAHGFQTLEDDTEVSYLMFEFYHPECARGVRWDDPAFAIRWPLADYIISARDQNFPDFTR